MLVEQILKPSFAAKAGIITLTLLAKLSKALIYAVFFEKQSG